MNQCVSQSKESSRLSAFQNKGAGRREAASLPIPTALRNHIQFQVHSLDADKGHGEAKRKPM